MIALVSWAGCLLVVAPGYAQFQAFSDLVEKPQPRAWVLDSTVIPGDIIARNKAGEPNALLSPRSFEAFEVLRTIAGQGTQFVQLYVYLYISWTHAATNSHTLQVCTCIYIYIHRHGLEE